MNISITNVATKLELKESQVEVVLNLLAEGATVPFIARYRQGVTGGLDEEIIQEINSLYVYDVELNKRKEAILNILAENKLLTPELEAKINEAQTKAEVENIYEPFKIGKKTKATDAIALGLEPLAKRIFEETDPNFNPYKEAELYLNEKVPNVEFALEQANYIISQWISQDVDTRAFVKKEIYNFGNIETKLKKGAEVDDPKEIFKIYYDHKERIAYVPNHRALAMSRGEDKKIISYSLTFNLNRISYELNNKYFKNKRTGKLITAAINDALSRLILPSIEREIKSDLFERAQTEAIKIFARNVETMLLWPAVKNKKVLAIDPAFVNGCKIAVLDANGNLLEKAVMYPNEPLKQTVKATILMNKLLDKYQSDIIVIGNGTASRETEEFVASIIRERKTKNPNEEIKYAVVSEIGASVYSASEIAIKEFPELSVEERSAINIGRRFQDPLNELVKIDPKSIGVGQYQHDVNQKELNQALTFKVDKVVNLVGVDVNSATEEILKYVSGLNKKVAGAIVAFRTENGSFQNREQLKKVKGLGAKAYEQAVGFLRIHDSKTFFDRTAIHPESYELAYKIVEKFNLDFDSIDRELLLKQDPEKLAHEFNSNKYDIQQILDALMNPTKDIRSEKEGYKLKDNLVNINDLQVGMIVDGSVLNITDFALFVYIGLKESAFVHKSKVLTAQGAEIGSLYEHFSIGDNIKLEIIEIDVEKGKVKGKIQL
ncbi:helix-hairpin-helix domain-containing protein [Mycoplasmopsis columbinasalis]|uniref:RNA (S1 domain)-binding protein n=1 Tax=Mycoplasmopsis columbinasalis TaxID=114880 RepID=A0A449BAN1_9BACT|nr:Tex-like N-terminal domain-containing protein [Mycoplasmopsis columbinasalis]VEU78246.1 RNA (S1 domain)-binding protein [Mycoplasmopsis columbinasalis]